MFPYIHSIYMSIKIKSIKNQPTDQPTNQTIKKIGHRPCPESRASV